jgi:HPt (histidine-containing phosphotransfer) domain-containing protein
MSPPALNLETALARLGGNREILQQLVELVRADAESLIERARGAFNLGDLKEVGLAAHNLRGAALNLDAAPTVDAAKALELAADRGDHHAAREALANLESVAGKLLEELDRVRSESES